MEWSEIAPKGRRQLVYCIAVSPRVIHSTASLSLLRQSKNDTTKTAMSADFIIVGPSGVNSGRDNVVAALPVRVVSGRFTMASWSSFCLRDGVQRVIRKSREHLLNENGRICKARTI